MNKHYVPLGNNEQYDWTKSRVEKRSYKKGSHEMEKKNHMAMSFTLSSFQSYMLF